MSKSFIISRDVIFYEHVFPFHSISHKLEDIDSFPDVVLLKFASDIPTYNAPDTSSFETPIEVTNGSHDLRFEHSSINDAPMNSIAVRRSSRAKNPLSYLRDFHCNLLINSQQVSDKFSYPLSKYISYDCFSPGRCSFLLSVSSNFEPQFYHQAVNLIIGERLWKLSWRQ